jgi:hypothetical protein
LPVMAFAMLENRINLGTGAEITGVDALPPGV